MKSWKRKAAEEIVDSGIVDSGRWTDATTVAAIIAKHHERIVKPEPGHVYDWAAKAGAYLHAESVRLSSHRIAAVVSHFAEPLVKMLREAKRDDHEPGCPAGFAQVGIVYEDEECSCSTGEWNKRIDEVLHGSE